MEFMKMQHHMGNINQNLCIMKSFLQIFGVIALSIFALSFTQTRTIKGKVSDNSGNPLLGVSVTAIPASSAGSAITDSKGIYSISVGQQTTKLRFILNGYSTKEIAIGNKTIVDVKLEPVLMLIQEDLAPEIAVRRDSRVSVPAMYQNKAMGSGINRINHNFNTEGYAPVNENGFRNVVANPLSTFSIDVDNAAYSNIRRFINSGQLPPADAVRIEEMINYFRYTYPEARGEHPFSVYTELAVCPWNREHQLLHVGLRARSIDKSSLPAANLVFLIDVSGSMATPNKLPLLKSAYSLLVNELRPKDRVAIVVYAGAAGLVLKSTPGDRKEIIMKAIDNLEAGGSTAGGEGLRLAYSEAEKNFIEGGNNRIILATDGDFNVGESSNGGIERMVEEKRKSGVFMTVLGFGMGNLKDDKMEIIADKGNGNYSYIDNLQEARKVLVSEFGGTLFTIAKDVKFQIEFNPSKVESYRLIGYENRLLNEEDFNDDKKDAGEMGSGHNVTALYELVPAGSEERTPAVDPLKYQSIPAARRSSDEDGSDEYLTIKLRYKLPDGETSRLMERSVKGYVADIEDASENLRFAAAVSEFGMILRDSEFRGNATFESAASLARSARGEDEEGYRAELIRLINTAKDLKMTSGK